MTSVRNAASGSHKLTRDAAINAIQEYNDRYGFVNSASFNPANAKWRGRQDLIDTYYQGRADGRPWPSLNSLTRPFDGSFTKACEAAGIEPNKTGPQGRAHAPIRDVKIQRVIVESSATREYQQEIDRLKARLERARARADHAETQARKVRVVPTTKTQVKTVVKKVTDSRAVTRLEARIEKLTGQIRDGRAALDAIQDQLAAAGRDRDHATRFAAALSIDLAVAKADATKAQADVKRLTDKLAVAEQNVKDLRKESQQTLKHEESEMIRQALMRADKAEERAARADREMAEQAAAITGEQRKLTSKELESLRANGPAGPKVLAAALGDLTKARAGRGDLAAALTKIASAALSWRDRLG